MSTVDRSRAPVKPARRYDGRSRQERALVRRNRIVEVAERAFLAGGYGSTTIAAIATEAGVSADTIYKSFGGKSGLVRAIYDAALRGREPVPAEERSEAIQVRERDGRAVIDAWGQFTAELSPRAAPLALLARDAAFADPDVATLVRDMEGARLARMRSNAGRLHAAGHLRSNVTQEHAATVMWLYTAPEVYELLVLKRGLSAEEYGQFVSDALAAALL